MTWQRELLVIALQRAARHWAGASRIYQALADGESDPDRRATYQVLGERAIQRSRDYEHRLDSLVAPLPHGQDTSSARLWRWVVLHLGDRAALAWLEWDERNYLRLFSLVASSRRRW
jgi:hypothetical protein